MAAENCTRRIAGQRFDRETCEKLERMLGNDVSIRRRQMLRSGESVLFWELETSSAIGSGPTLFDALHDAFDTFSMSDRQSRTCERLGIDAMAYPPERAGEAPYCLVELGNDRVLRCEFRYTMTRAEIEAEWERLIERATQHVNRNKVGRRVTLETTPQAVRPNTEDHGC